MEIRDQNLSVFYMNRLFGLAPFELIRNQKGLLVGFRTGKLWFGYSAALITLAVVFAINSIVYDIQSEIPVRETMSFYTIYGCCICFSGADVKPSMKSPTSKVVTCLDIGVVVGASASSVICSLLGVAQTKEMNRRLYEADEFLAAYTESLKNKIVTILMNVITLVGITLTIAADLVVWYGIARELSTNHHDVAINVSAYLPIYFLYYIIMVFQVQLAQTALGIGNRFHRINIILRTVLLKEKTNMYVTRLPSLRNINRIVDELGNNKKSQRDPTQAPTISVLTQSLETNPEPLKLNQVLDSITDIYSSLAKAMECVSMALGPAILMGLVSSLLHLVVTAYFLLLELLTKGFNPFTLVQFAWITIHTARLILLVEPCHRAFYETQKTSDIISDAIRRPASPEIKDKLEMFWRQLLVQRTYFNACGMCKIDRQILTAYCSAIATYLVILMQFQRSDGS